MKRVTSLLVLLAALPGALRAQEAAYYAPDAQLETYVLPGAGHSLALHRNAEDYRDATRAWLGSKFGM